MQSSDLESFTRSFWANTLSRTTRLAWWPVAWMLIMLCALPAHAQYGASLQGTVADSTGAVIPGATVTLTDTETNRVLTTQSNASGGYFFGTLGPSSYRIDVSRDGFKKKTIDNVKIIAEQPNSLNIAMEVGTTSESVTVNADAQPLIDTSTGSVGATLDQNEIAKLPSFGRDVFQLMQLTPGMFGDGAQSRGGGTAGMPGNQGPGGSGGSSGVFQTENRPQVVANGGRNDTNGISLDGVGITSVTWGSAAIVTPSEDSIKEVKVTSSGYDAEWGRNSGGQIQVTSQNGTNNLHGTAFFKVDRPGLNAFQRWDPNNNPQRNNNRFNQFGGTVGGPILRNKLFGFFSYETIRNHSVQTGGGWYDTASFDTMSSSNSIANKFLTLKGAGAVYTKILENPGDNHACASINLVQGVNCNWIQGQGLDLGRPLTSVPLGTQDPSWAPQQNGVYTPGLGGDGTGNYATNMDGNADIMYVATVGPNNNTNQQFNGRVDYQATDKDLIAASLYYVPVDSSFYNGPSRASNFFNHNAKNYSTGALYNHTFSPTMLNEARADMAGWKWNELTSNPQSPLGLPDVSANQFSTQSVGFGPSVGSVFDQWTFNVKDVLTKVQHSHSLKFGGQVTRLAYLDEPTWFGQPSYGFNNLWDFINDAPYTESITADPRTGQPSAFRKDTRGNVLAFFVQDDWKVKPNLTINAGLRWEYFGGMTEKQGHLANLRLGQGANTLTGIRFALGGAEFTAPKGNFGPQIGFAWTPDRMKKLVLRGGFGIGYNGLEYAITTNTRNNPPYLANGGTLTGSQIVYGAASNVYQFGALPANPNMITQFNANNLPVANVQLSATGLPAELPTAYTYRYSLQGQYDLGNHWVATLGYSGTMGRHLPLQYDLNKVMSPQVIAGAMTYNPKLNFIDWYADSGASSFNSMLAELEHQFARNFQIDAQYRWSKSLDNGSGPYTMPDYQFLPGYNWGPSDFDSRNMFKLWGLWSPVIFRGQNNWMEKLAGGWTFSGIMNWHSGFPFNPTYSSNCSVIENYNGCQTGYRSTKYLGGGGTSQSTDTFKKPRGNFPNPGSTYFAMPVQPVGTLWPSNGTAPTPGALPAVPGIGRNAFYGPRYWDTDFTITKAFGLPSMKVLGENARFEVRANAYNLFNQLNLTGIDSGINDTYFGGARSVMGSRTIEMEAHFKF